MFFLQEWETTPEFFVSSDAAGNAGYCAVYNNEWFAGEWPEPAKSVNIAVKDFIPIVIATNIWGPSWFRRRVAFKCDNIAVVHCIRKGLCKDRHLAFLLRELSIVAITSDFLFTSSHVTSKEKYQADALSRLKFQDCRSAIPSITHCPRDVPQDLLMRLVSPPWMQNGNRF